MFYEAVNISHIRLKVAEKHEFAVFALRFIILHTTWDKQLTRQL